MSRALKVERSLLGQPWVWRAAPLDLGGGARLGLDDLSASLFLSRGCAPADIARLLRPTLRDWMPDPSIFIDMDAAAERLADAVQRQQSVVIFGDYDVDGATSAAILIRLLRSLGGVASHYIPDRLLEGYGPSADALVALKRAGADLVVAVDCGTQGFAALEAAKAAGLDVIVVDHHKASTALPPAIAIVNPNRLDEGAEAAAHGHLCTAGLAFLLGAALNRVLRCRGWFETRPEPRLAELLDIVALGTVADVVPLTGLNRAFVALGLRTMAARRNPGIAALFDVAKQERAPTARDLGFVLGPRINAGGRVGQADLGVRLLTTEDAAEARALAETLDEHNRERRTIEQLVTDAAMAMAEKTANAPVAVVAGPGWHPGVIGIAAGRLKERLHKPAIVIGVEGRTGKGSGRSVEGVDLGSAILAAKEAGLLEAGGGHAMAAGLTIAAGKIDAFTQFLCERLGGDCARASDGRALSLDLAVAAGGVTVTLADALEAAGPYGQGWPAPRVAVGPVQILKASIVGAAHVRFEARGRDGGYVKGIAFRAADSALGQGLLTAGERPHWLAGRVKKGEWNGRVYAEMELDDAALA
ncbi:single-stranded-DNA-specific exonuclease RecJ [Sandaracinobacteroides saxicola]|uniref:Single-stranded-DNA-specific exonuclease RecJ n=1 Tax=Sandaracinobacteroides saxicola TaxID=2759707 RepID=A0A7G5IGR5_9SPHN|nr:single-stranded-DNA-specific exonuclease RecJ [Sandaracinobacteroides saxicola]QMW22557.1 single-stranded-DNA-specific exonuclease RecJ [Sandaracinobacteroides saxicola]